MSPELGQLPFGAEGLDPQDPQHALLPRLGLPRPDSGSSKKPWLLVWEGATTGATHLARCGGCLGAESGRLLPAPATDCSRVVWAARSMCDGETASLPQGL